MSLFRCDRCGCVENTAPSGYWNKGDGPALCTECDPDIAKWHGIFPKQSAKGMILASDGFLYSKEDTESASFKWRMEHQGLKVVREITEDGNS